MIVISQGLPCGIVSHGSGYCFDATKAFSTMFTVLSKECLVVVVRLNSKNSEEESVLN